MNWSASGLRGCCAPPMCRSVPTPTGWPTPPNPPNSSCRAPSRPRLKRPTSQRHPVAHRPVAHRRLRQSGVRRCGAPAARCGHPVAEVGRELPAHLERDAAVGHEPADIPPPPEQTCPLDAAPKHGVTFRESPRPGPPGSNRTDPLNPHSSYRASCWTRSIWTFRSTVKPNAGSTYARPNQPSSPHARLGVTPVLPDTNL